MSLNCLDKIIGLSTTLCSCFDDGKPVDFSESNSGLQLDKLEGLELRTIKGDVECGDNNIWDKMDTARANATLAFRTDLLAAIGEVTRERRKMFQGIIGQRTFNADRINGKVYNGLVIRCADIKGGEFTLKDIKTLMNANANFSVEVWNNIQTTPLLTIPNINALAGQLTDNPLTPDPLLTFPLWTEECTDPSFSLEYYIVYNPVGFEPKNNKVDCGCSKRNEWESWAWVEGICGDDITERQRWNKANFANGLVLDIQFNCNTAELICGGQDEPLDFINDAKAMVMAYAIRFKAGEILIEDILASGNINRYTMLAKERLWGKRNHFVKEYNSRIQYLASRLDTSSNDCLACGDDRINVNSILV